nr:MAG: putative capsid protein [Arizlama virus]
MEPQPARSRLSRATGLAIKGLGYLGSQYVANRLYDYTNRPSSAVVSRPSRPMVSSKLGQRLYTRKPMRYLKSKKKNTMKKRLKNLERAHNDTMSKLIFKYDTKDTIRVAAGTAGYGYKSSISGALIESAISNCRYFDPSNPGTLITASLATPTYKQNILVSASSSMVIQNNYQVPVVVTFGLAFPRRDTSIDPTSAMQNGLVDVGNPDNTSTLVSYKDSPQFRDLWKVKLRSKVLKPGQKVVYKHFQKAFTYDPALADSHNMSFQKVTKSAVWIYRVQGILGHDSSVSSEQGMLPAGIDAYFNTNYIVTYDSGGASIRTIVLSENASQTFTNGGVVSQIVADNQAYSIS